MQNKLVIRFRVNGICKKRKKDKEASISFKEKKKKKRRIRVICESGVELDSSLYINRYGIRGYFCLEASVEL